jgi:peptide deformylase
MSETIVFDTEAAVQNQPLIRQVETFHLVPENDPILAEVMPEFDFLNPAVNPSEFASTLVETCKLHNGYGLSANQCGFRYRVFVMGTNNDYVAFFNPSIVLKSKKEVHMTEGCLSFPLLPLSITRPEEIAVTYQDFNGEWKQATFTGISARCFQHELDHMNGIVYTTRCKPLALQRAMKKRGKVNHLISKFKKVNEKLAQIHGNTN